MTFKLYLNVMLAMFPVSIFGKLCVVGGILVNSLVITYMICFSKEA